MTRKDVETLKEVLCPHDEDYDTPCISPHNLEIVLEQVLLDNETKYSGGTEEDMKLVNVEEVIDVIDQIESVATAATLLRNMIDEIPERDGRPKGKWKVHKGSASHDIRCPFCHNVEVIYKVKELADHHYCYKCGAELEMEDNDWVRNTK